MESFLPVITGLLRKQHTSNIREGHFSRLLLQTYFLSPGSLSHLYKFQAGYTILYA